MTSSDAEALNLLMLQVNSKMNDSVWFVKDKGTAEEFASYRAQAAQVMAALLDVCNSIYERHPHLQPEELGGPYAIQKAIFRERFYVPKEDEDVQLGAQHGTTTAGGGFAATVVVRLATTLGHL